jgi:hypothetical protein
MSETTYRLDDAAFEADKPATIVGVKRKVKPVALPKPMSNESEPPQLLIEDDLVFVPSVTEKLPPKDTRVIEPLTMQQKRDQLKILTASVKDCEKRIPPKLKKHPLYVYLHALKDSIKRKEIERKRKMGVKYEPWDSLGDEPVDSSVVIEARNLVGTPSELQRIVEQIEMCEQLTDELDLLKDDISEKGDYIFLGEYVTYLNTLLEFARAERTFRKLFQPFWAKGAVKMRQLKRLASDTPENLVDILEDRLRNQPELEPTTTRTKKKLKDYEDLLTSVFAVQDTAESKNDAVNLGTLLKEAMVKVQNGETVDMNMFNPLYANMDTDYVLNVLRRVWKQGQSRSFGDGAVEAKKKIWVAWLKLVEKVRKKVELQSLEDAKADDYDEDDNDAEQGDEGEEIEPCTAKDEATPLARNLHQVASEMRNGWRYDGSTAVRITANDDELADPKPINVLAQTLDDMMRESGPKATRDLVDRLLHCIDPDFDKDDEEQADTFQNVLNFVDNHLTDLLDKAKKSGEYEESAEEDEEDKEKDEEEEDEVEDKDTEVAIPQDISRDSSKYSAQGLDMQRAREIVDSMTSQFEDIALRTKGLMGMNSAEIKSHRRALRDMWDTFRQLGDMFGKGAGPGPKPRRVSPPKVVEKVSGWALPDDDDYLEEHQHLINHRSQAEDESDYQAWRSEGAPEDESTTDYQPWRPDGAPEDEEVTRDYRPQDAADDEEVRRDYQNQADDQEDKGYFLTYHRPVKKEPEEEDRAPREDRTPSKEAIDLLNKEFSDAKDRVRRGKNLSIDDIHKFSQRFVELSPETTFIDQDVKGFRRLSAILRDYEVNGLMEWIHRARVLIQHYNDIRSEDTKKSKNSKKFKKSKTVPQAVPRRAVVPLLPRENDIVQSFMRYVGKLKYADKCPAEKQVPQACFNYIKAAVNRWNRKPENRHAFIPIPDRWG